MEKDQKKRRRTSEEPVKMYNTGLKKTKAQKRKHLLEKLRGSAMLILELILAVMLAFGFSTFFCKKVVIHEGSMEPNLRAGETFLLNSFSYAFGSPKRGDVIAFTTGEHEDAVVHLKRVVGMPGETVQIIDGQIYINGSVLLEDASYPTIISAGRASDPITLDGDEYFVLGDNRNGSEDSRYAEIGNVKSADIIGKVWFRIAPLSSFGFAG